MPKVCPFLLIDLQPIDRNHPEQYACLEEECAWFISNRDTHGCAIPILTAIAHDLALVRYPSLAGKKRGPGGTGHAEKRP